MRRTDREVCDKTELRDIIEACEVCHLGLFDEEVGIPYVVPLNFGYEWGGEDKDPETRLTLWFHCANEGRKLDLIRKNPTVCFEMDCGHELVPSSQPCAFTMRYASIIGTGCLAICEDPSEKLHGLTLLMQHHGYLGIPSFPEKQLARTTVLKLTATTFTGKCLRK